MKGRAHAWFWCLFACGALLRAGLAIGSEGTDDVLLWTQHAAGVSHNGLAQHYALSPLFNHPPPAAWSMARLFELAGRLDLEFRTLYRLLVVGLDLANVLLLVRLLGAKPWRWIAGAVYALSPVAIVLSGEHGNLDPLVASCALSAALAVGSSRALLAGVLIGMGGWVKLPALLAAPALGWALPRWRERVLCAAVATTVGAAPYLWGLWATRDLQAREWDAARRSFVIDARPEAPNVFAKRVFLYQGTMIRVTGARAEWLWGWRNIMARLYGLPRDWPAWARAWRDAAVPIALAAILLLAFLRRRAREPAAVGVSVALSYALFYGLVNDCATQYFAWSAPLWLCLGLALGGTLHALMGVFIYGLYALCCHDALLRGWWRFDTLTDWPVWLRSARDLSNAAFLALGLGALARAALLELARWRERATQR